VAVWRLTVRHVQRRPARRPGTEQQMYHIKEQALMKEAQAFENNEKKVGENNRYCFPVGLTKSTFTTTN
jgi:hypothetical protein